MITSKPLILFIAGYAGSGKTMVGKIIAGKLHAPYLDKDTLFRPLIEQSLFLTTGNRYNYTSAFYNENFKRLEYETMLNIGIENAKLNPVTVLTGPFTDSPGSASFNDPEWIETLDKRCQKIGARWHLVWIRTSSANIKTMLERRGAPRDTWKLSHWDEYTTNYGIGADEISFPFKNHTFITNDNRHIRDIEKDIDAFLRDIVPQQ